jgi:O-antigen/teichoic acid export membrane protein
MLARVAVLARLLESAHFGIFAMVCAVMMPVRLVGRLIAGGLETVVVQRRQLDQRVLQAIWTIQVLRGFAVAALLVLVSLAVEFLLGGSVAESGESAAELLLVSAPYLRIVAASVALGGLISPGASVLDRRLDFRKGVAAAMAAMVVTVAGTCLAAWYWPGPGALMTGLVLHDVTRVIVSYVVVKFRPRFLWDWKLAREILGFGRAVAWAQTATEIMTQLDNMVVGWLCGKDVLGHYAMSYNVVSMPVHRFSVPFNRAVFSAFSRIQESASRMSRALVRTIRVLVGLLAPAMIGVSIMSAEAVRVALGAKWTPIVPLVSLLALAGLFRSVSGAYGAWIVAAGRPGILARLKLLEAALFVGLVLGLTWYAGVLGAVWAVLIIYALDHLLCILTAGRIEREVFRPLLSVLLRTGACCALMAAAALPLRLSLSGQALWLRASAPSVAGAVVYGVAVLLLNRRLWADLIEAKRSLVAAQGGGQ